VTAAYRAAVDIALAVACGQITEESVPKIAACIAKHIDEDVLGDLRAVQHWPGAVHALAVRRGVLASQCIDCGRVYAVTIPEGAEPGVSHGLDSECARRRDLEGVYDR